MSKKIHKDQTEEFDDASNTGIICFNVIINPELLSLLRSYGSEIEILSSENLRSIILDEIKKNLNQYLKE